MAQCWFVEKLRIKGRLNKAGFLLLKGAGVGRRESPAGFNHPRSPLSAAHIPSSSEEESYRSFP
jgi:hypothetical protein